MASLIIARRRSQRRVQSSGRTTTRTHTPAVKPVLNKQGHILTPGTPATTSVTSTPAMTTSEQQSIPEVSVSPNAGGIVLALFILLIFVGWSSFFSPLWNSIWNKKPFQSSISPWTIVGAIIFIFFMAILATSSDEGNTLAWLLVLGLWTVYIMFNGSSEIAGFFNFLSENHPTKSSGNNVPLTSQQSRTVVNL